MSTKILTASLLFGAALAVFPVSANDSSALDENDMIFDRNEVSVILALNDRGIKATSVEEWAGVVRAFVQDDEGHTTFQFFTPDRLEAINQN